MSENIREVPITPFFEKSYIDYAMEVALDRSLLYIDGLKPVSRKVLYSMHELGCEKKFVKCARIVGDCMGKYHPHGDSSIYGNLCYMSDTYQAYLAPYIKAKGNLGRKWSDPKHPNSVAPSKMRYPEAMLTKLAADIFDGLSENAVNMIPNFDYTEKEPELLPVKFPTVITNAASGIAVALSTYNPSYPLKNVCEATSLMARGIATEPEDIVDVLGYPDFAFGGDIRGTKHDLMKLLKTGKAKFQLLGAFSFIKGGIRIDWVPKTTTFEKVADQLTAFAKTNEGKAIKRIVSNVGLKTTGLVVETGDNIDKKALLKKILAYTDVMDDITFRTQIVWGGKPVELGVFELLQHWLEFRSECVRRVAEFRYNKISKRLHELEVWNIVKDNLDDVINIIKSNKEAMAKELLIETFEIDDAQADYLFGVQLKRITTDNVIKALEEIEKVKEEQTKQHALLTEESVRMEYISDELLKIAEKYGIDRITNVGEPLDGISRKEVADVIPDTEVMIGVTSSGKVNSSDVYGIKSNLVDSVPSKENLVGIVTARMNDYIVIYTDSGFAYRVPVHKINKVRNAYNQSVWDIVSRKDVGNIVMASSRKTNTTFNVVYATGRGKKIFVKNIIDGRKECYINAFEPTNGEKGFFDITKEDKFFVISNKKRAAYADTTNCGIEVPGFGKTREAFKFGRMDNDRGEYIFGIQPLSEVPNVDNIDLGKYTKGYFVKIKEDKLWETAADREQARLAEAESEETINYGEDEIGTEE